MKVVSTKAFYLPPNWPDINFASYLVGEALSIPCYLFVFYHLLFHISYAQRGTYVPFNPAICLLYQFVDFVRTTRGRLVFHYIPLVCFALYAPIFYFYLLFIYPCECKYNANAFLCDSPWYNCSVPTALSPLIVILSGSFLIRVIVRQRRLQQGYSWRKKNRKMILPFIFITVAYIIFVLPFVILTTMATLGITNYTLYYADFIT
ncbi:hypothetical protein I4U23_003568 [Adineta vaga]|nr:hypothetical protein I4U23_003568 [Adineta vaga]